MINRYFLNLFLILSLGHAQAKLQDFQTQEQPDYPVVSWRCGAPLVQALRTKDPKHLLDDPRGNLLHKQSLSRISDRNLAHFRKKLLPLTNDEQKLLTIITQKWLPPIVHRSNLAVMKIILTKNLNLRSPTKRNSHPNKTPGIEQSVFSGWDCIFASVVPPYGISMYGNVLIRLKNKRNFAFGTKYAGFTWMGDKYNMAQAKSASLKQKRLFAHMLYTNESWPQAIAYQVIYNLRHGTSIRSKGPGLKGANTAPKVMHYLLNRYGEDSPLYFWSKINFLRLAYLEGKFADDITLDDIDYIEFVRSDESEVRSWNLPNKWFNNQFIRFSDWRKE